ncbi:hypothetical protein B0J13DRAFT_589243 [Dactylonectria estremocensis]|uniref:Uncharacterized protein n=1 Tax=Dactylonectria estremocensis TaxID=1079267 RepID=A0A9P9DQ96_9HYPO|nr:hypothetical protein B0J13DRAFT_589243 [Dactylonectria estremocensis]
MDVVKAIKKTDSQGLSTADRNEVAASCRTFIQRVEVSEALNDALLAEQPDFKGFSRTSLTRLPVLLNAVAEDTDVRINSLQDAEPITLIVLGLCLSTKKIRRMSAELWTEHLRQAQEIAKRLRALVLTQDGIAEAIRVSANEKFQQYTDNKNYHKYDAGSIRKFECDAKCISISFVQGDKVILIKSGPGSMANVPSDISITAQGGATRGS